MLRTHQFDALTERFMPVIESRLQIPNEMIIHETEHWVINHNFASALPGYLILGSKARAALHEFAELLARSQAILQRELAPKHLYVSRYGHSSGYPVHFHLIPVYDWVEKLFWDDRRYRLLDTFANPQKAETRTDGAELTLFIWREFGERAHPPAIEGPSIPEVVEQVRAAFTGRD
jgi:diadenosine tetraphosphate (Ap4A) HIT family hydrolase